MSGGDSGAPLPKSVPYRIFLVFFGMFQITLGAGLIVGWAAIAGSMLVESPSSGGAGLTLDETTQMFGLAVSVNYCSPLFLGFILDRFGPRCCSVVSNGIVAVGCLWFATSRRYSMFAVGICLVAFGGPGVQTSLIHTGNLFPDRRFFVMGCVAETICLSFAVFPLMDVLWQTTSLGFRDLFGGLGALLSVSAFSSLLLWPDHPYEVKESSSTLTTDEHDEVEMEATLLTGNDDDEITKESSRVPLQEASFQEQLTSGVFLRLVTFFLVTSYWANVYIATVTIELGDQQRFDPVVQHQLAVLLSFIDAGAIICAPLSGYLLDSVGFAPTGIVAICLGILQMILLLVAGSNVPLMVASFVSYAIYRAFLFPYYFASLSKKIGFRFFGILSGIGFCTSGLSQLSIAPLASIVEGTCHEYDDITMTDCSQGKWDTLHIIQIVTLVILLLIPIMDSRDEAKKEAQMGGQEERMPESLYGSLGHGQELIGESFRQLGGKELIGAQPY